MVGLQRNQTSKKKKNNNIKREFILKNLCSCLYIRIKLYICNEYKYNLIITNNKI